MRGMPSSCPEDTKATPGAPEASCPHSRTAPASVPCPGQGKACPCLPVTRRHLESKRVPSERLTEGWARSPQTCAWTAVHTAGQTRAPADSSRAPGRQLGPCVQAAFCSRLARRGALAPSSPGVSVLGAPSLGARSPSKLCSWAASVVCRARLLSRRAVSSSARLRLASFSSISLVQQV